MDPQLDLQMGRFAVHFRYFYFGCYGRSLEDICFWVFFLRCFLGFREAEYGFDHSLIMPNAHHIFGSRHPFYEFVVSSLIHFGGCWIFFLFCGVLCELWRRPRLQRIFDTILGQFFGFQSSPGNGTNLRTWPRARRVYILIHGFRRICRYSMDFEYVSKFSHIRKYIYIYIY